MQTKMLYDANLQNVQQARLEQVPGMAYVPAQAWREPYPLTKGFQNGTIFPILNKPFDPYGRCMKG